MAEAPAPGKLSPPGAPVGCPIPFRRPAATSPSLTRNAAGGPPASLLAEAEG